MELGERGEEGGREGGGEGEREGVSFVVSVRDYYNYFQEPHEKEPSTLLWIKIRLSGREGRRVLTLCSSAG